MLKQVCRIASRGSNSSKTCFAQYLALCSILFFLKPKEFHTTEVLLLLDTKFSLVSAAVVVVPEVILGWSIVCLFFWPFVC